MIQVSTSFKPVGSHGPLFAAVLRMVVRLEHEAEASKIIDVGLALPSPGLYISWLTYQYPGRNLLAQKICILPTHSEIDRPFLFSRPP